MRFLSGRVILGSAILIAGGLLLLNNLVEGFSFSTRDILKFWPVIPLLVGLNWAYMSFGSVDAEGGRKAYFSWGQFISALILIAVGVVYLGRNLELFYVDTSYFWNLIWPVALILIGINLIRGRSFSGGKENRFAFMGGTNVGGVQPWKLENGSYFALMGGIDIDLTAAELEQGETLLDLTAVMGGIDVKVGKGMAVICEGSAVLGGVSLKGQEDGGIIASGKMEINTEGETKSILRIQARAILGGIEIKEA